MVINMVVAARQVARMHVESLYESTCTVYSYAQVYSKETHSTRVMRNVLLADIPCHISYSSAPSNSATDTVSVVNQTIKLFLPPEHEIPPGAVIEVTSYGRKVVYKAAGQTAVYQTHQEISLVIEDDKA